jgi:hypothetical protein
MDRSHSYPIVVSLKLDQSCDETRFGDFAAEYIQHETGISATASRSTEFEVDFPSHWAGVLGLLFEESFAHAISVHNVAAFIRGA